MFTHENDRHATHAAGPRSADPPTPQAVIACYTALVTDCARALDGDWDVTDANVAQLEAKLQAITGILLHGAPRLAEALDIATQALVDGGSNPQEALARIALILQPEPAILDSVRQCRACGCTAADCSGCIARTGQPCSWVEYDLCSACVHSAGAEVPRA